MADLKTFGVEHVTTVKTTIFIRAETRKAADRKAQSKIMGLMADIPMEGEDGLVVPEIKMENIFDGDLHMAEVRLAKCRELAESPRATATMDEIIAIMVKIVKATQPDEEV